MSIIKQYETLHDIPYLERVASEHDFAFLSFDRKIPIVIAVFFIAPPMLVYEEYIRYGYKLCAVSRGTKVGRMGS